ncbi:MAG: glycosyltransferase [Muribaculaceae bacterium]|nr:glycosyltransferase [Muribaculaceae bacterium]
MKPLKVTLISHSDRLGGAAIVTFRLMQALRKVGVDARMITFVKSSEDENVIEACHRNKRAALFLVERGCIFLQNGFSKKDLFKVSIANIGLHLEKHPWVIDADVIVLNWINQGMLSLEGIDRLSALGKPIIWTMHDMWCLTGICHHAHECRNYEEQCGKCPYLHLFSLRNDLSHRVWMQKKELYSRTNIHFVAVSNWLAKRCKESSLLRDKPISVIHNAFPIEFYMTKPTAPVVEYGIDYTKDIIIMGAARLDDPIKGFEIAIEALNIFKTKYPDIAKNCISVFFGDIRDSSLLDRIKLPHKHIGVVNDAKMLRQTYACSKVVLSTSLYETLPGTLIEGQAAGCVPVSFGKGGQRDIIDHKKNGYIAEYLSPESIADGILWALENAPDRDALHEEVNKRFAGEVIANKYIELCNKLLSQR